MSDPRFLQDGFDLRLAHFVEECGEALAAAGKTLRWGAYSANPLLSPNEQEENIVWLMREMDDVEQAIRRLRDAAREEGLVCAVLADKTAAGGADA